MIKRPIFSPRINIGQRGPAGGATGPGTSTANDIVIFTNTDGQTLSDSGKAHSTDGTFASNSDAKVPTEKAVKTYIDASVSGFSVSDASTTVKGKVELATDAETIAMTDTVRAITPSNLLAFASLMNPIGTIREFNVSTNPNTLLGFGTWTAYGVGRGTVCLDSGDATMDTVDETGGAQTVTIGQTNLPNISTGAGTAHTHTQNSHTHTVAGLNTGGAGGVRIDAATGSTHTSSATTATNQNESAHTHSLGGSGTALNVMNPFIVVYRWVRTS